MNQPRTIEEKIEEMISTEFGFCHKEGSYFSWLSRFKEAVQYGTSTINDFVELEDDGFVAELKQNIKSLIEAERKTVAIKLRYMVLTTKGVDNNSDVYGAIKKTFDEYLTQKQENI